MPTLLTASDTDVQPEHTMLCHGAELQLHLHGKNIHCCLPSAIKLVERATTESRNVIAYLLTTEHEGVIDGVQFSAQSLGTSACDLHTRASRIIEQ